MKHFELVLQITLFNAEYGRCIDDDRLEEWPGFFHDSCIYRVTTDENFRANYETSLIYADGKHMLVDRITALRNANIFEKHRYRHLIGTPTLLAANGSDTQAESPFAVFRTMVDGTTALFATGRYRDCFRSSEGSIRLSERVVICDSSIIDTLLVVPL